MEKQVEKNQVVVNLKELFRKMLVQWRGVLVIALIFGIIFMGLKYVMDVRKAAAAPASAQQEEADVSQALTPAEKVTVENAVLIAANLSNLQNYMDQAPLMKIDPFHVNVLTLSYLVTDQDKNGAATIAQLLRRNMNTQQINKDVAAVIAPDAPPEFVGELISFAATSDSAANASNAYFYAEIILPDGSEGKADQVKAVFDKNVAACSNQIRSAGYSAAVSLVQSGVVTENNSSLNDKQANLQTRVMNTNNSLKTMVASFTDAQKKAFVEMCEEKNVTISTTVISSDKMPNIEDPAVKKASPSKKWFALGFIIGILLYLLAQLIRSAFRGKVQGREDLAWLYGLRCFGEYRAFTGKSAFSRLINSRNVYRHFYKENTDKEKSAAAAAGRILHSMEIGGFDSIDLIVPGRLSQAGDSYLRSIADKIREKGKSADIVVYEAGSDEQVPGSQRMLVCSAGLPYEQVSEQMLDAQESGAWMPGMILIQEI